MIVELRVYRCLPGQMPALMNRFRNATMNLFDRHGFQPIGFFTTLIGGSHQELTYLLRWESLAQMEGAWKALFTDPEWLVAKTESEKNGFIVDNTSSKILSPTNFSPLR